MSMTNTGGLRYALVLVALLLVSILWSGCAFKIEEYVIPRGMPFGWVVIDSNRKECPPRPAGLIVSDIRLYLLLFTSRSFLVMAPICHFGQ